MADSAPIRYLSLFSGAGGLDLAVRIALPESRSVCMVENDAATARILAARMAEGSLEAVPVYSDARTFCGECWRGAVDLVIAGWPCPPVSVAGDRLGIDDERWLWPEVVRVVRECGPRWVFLENVGGLLSANDGRAFGQVLGDLAGLGFDAEWLTLRASDVGAAQERRRVFILAERRCAERGAGDECGGRSAERGDGERQAAGGTGRGHEGVEYRRGRGFIISSEEKRLRWWTESADEALGLARCERDERRRDAGLLGETEGTQSDEAGERQRHGNADSGAGEAVGWTEQPRWAATRTGTGLDAGTQPQARGGELGHSLGARLEERRSESGDAGEECATALGTGDRLFPPGQGSWSDWYTSPDGSAIRIPQDGDAEAWCAILRDAPWLLPATEPGVRLLAHGMEPDLGADRADQLRACGNGVVALQGAVALRVLAGEAK